MKKLLVFGSVILFSFGLAGCDLIPTEIIEEVSDVLCSEDPTNELCQLDDLSDIGDQVILDLFNDVLSNYNADDLETYCEEYFSASNVDLLDACKLDTDTLFPQGVENFEAVSVNESEGNFNIVLMDSNTNQTYEFKVGISGGLVAGIVIASWSFEEVVNEFEGIEEMLLVREVLAFVSDLEDTTKSNEDVCAMWYDGRDNDCDGVIEDARTRFKAGSDLSKKVNILDDDDDDDSILTGTVSFEHNGHVTVLKIMLDVDNSAGEVKVRIKDLEMEFSPNPKTEEQLKMLVEDLTNPELNDAEVCRIWGDGVDDDCNGIVALDPVIKHKFILKTITPIGDDMDNPMYEATYESDFNGHVTVLKISFTEDVTQEGRALSNLYVSLFARGAADDNNDVDDKEEAMKLYQMFLDAYMDSTITRDMLKTYFEILPSEEYFEMRDMHLTTGTQIVLVAMVGPRVIIGPDVTIGTYGVIFDDGNGDEMNLHYETVIIRKRIDQTTPLLSILDPDDDGDGILTEEKLAALDDFKNDLNDHFVEMEDFFTLIPLDGIDGTTCPAASPYHCGKAADYNVDSIELLEVDGQSNVRIRVRPIDGKNELEEMTNTYFVFFYYNDKGNIAFELILTNTTIDPDVPQETLPVFTLDELAMYTGASGSTAYIAVDGVVYDVTLEFDNGQHQDMQLGGTDATEVFATSPHSAEFLASLMIVGSLEGYELIVVN